MPKILFNVRRYSPTSGGLTGLIKKAPFKRTHEFEVESEQWIQSLPKYSWAGTGIGSLDTAVLKCMFFFWCHSQQVESSKIKDYFPLKKVTCFPINVAWDEVTRILSKTILHPISLRTIASSF